MTDDTEYGSASRKVLDGLDPVRKRPDYYLVGDFDHVNPKTVYDVLMGWSEGFLTTKAVEKLLSLDPLDPEETTVAEAARGSGVLPPVEEAIEPEEAAAILGDVPVDGDPTYSVKQRIKDARLLSLTRSVVEARRAFEDKHR